MADAAVLVSGGCDVARPAEGLLGKGRLGRRIAVAIGALHAAGEMRLVREEPGDVRDALHGRRGARHRMALGAGARVFDIVTTGARRLGREKIVPARERGLGRRVTDRALDSGLPVLRVSRPDLVPAGAEGGVPREEGENEGRRREKKDPFHRIHPPSARPNAPAPRPIVRSSPARSLTSSS